MESLEDRNLLSGASATLAAEVISSRLKTVPRTIKGTISGDFVVNATLEVSLTGDGILKTDWFDDDRQRVHSGRKPQNAQGNPR